MKQSVILLTIAVMIFLTIKTAQYFQNQALPIIQSPLPSPSVSTTDHSIFGLVENENSLTAITVADKVYRYKWEVIDPQQISIGINTDLATDSASLQQMNHCSVLTNAGFYGKNNQPIGLLMNNSVKLSSWQSNQLFNGVIGYTGQTLLVDSSPSPIFQWAVQAGPILWSDYQPAVLHLNRDQPARRIIAGISADNKLIMMVVVAEDSLYNGPFLADVPKILSAVTKADTDLNLKDAINFDGGTASAYLTPSLRLKELQPIGSYL